MNTYGRHSAPNSNDFVEEDFVKKANSSDLDISTTGNEISLSHRGTKRVRIDANGVQVDNLTAANASLPQYVPRSEPDFLRSGTGVSIGTIDNHAVHIRQNNEVIVDCTSTIEDQRIHVLRELVSGPPSGDYERYTTVADIAPLELAEEKLNNAVFENPLGLDPDSTTAVDVVWDPNVKSGDINIAGPVVTKTANNDIAWVYSDTQIFPHRYDYTVRITINAFNYGNRAVFGFNEVKQNYSTKLTNYSGLYPDTASSPSLGAGVTLNLTPTNHFIHSTYAINKWASNETLSVTVGGYFDFRIVGGAISQIIYSSAPGNYEDILVTRYSSIGAPLQLGEAGMYLFIYDQVSSGNSSWSVNASIQSQQLRGLSLSTVLKNEFKVFQDAMYNGRIPRYDADSYMVRLPGIVRDDTYINADNPSVTSSFTNLKDDMYFLPLPVKIGQRLLLKNESSRYLYLASTDLESWQYMPQSPQVLELISTETGWTNVSSAHVSQTKSETFTSVSSSKIEISKVDIPSRPFDTRKLITMNAVLLNLIKADVTVHFTVEVVDFYTRELRHTYDISKTLHDNTDKQSISWVHPYIGHATNDYILSVQCTWADQDLADPAPNVVQINYFQFGVSEF